MKKAYLGRGFESRMACNLGWAEAASALGAPRFFPPGPASQAKTLAPGGPAHLGHGGLSARATVSTKGASRAS